MNNLTGKVMVDFANGNITGVNSKDDVTLIGISPYKGSSYVNDIEIVVKQENGKTTSIKFPYSGYDMQLFLGDFTGDNKSDIIVRGGFGGSGGFEIGVIYKYENEKLIEIFNQNSFYENNKCQAAYKDNYKLNINCGKSKYTVNLASRPKEYLDLIYTSDGKVKPTYEPYVDAPSAILPTKQIYNNFYELIILQRVVGLVNSDTIASIQTLLSLENSKNNIIYKGLLFLPGEDTEN
ncbi:hypothetical protein GCM10008904_26460 [Paraclostridium ghonii]|uniref:VCBS repeat-containing protein n=1 Tax=Paraclostridium ghonii TaxID=29358 RepID=A0ABU0MXR8_9FIRM|nr:hypothetical protein [Paeniclostridium ghonii]MDQ0555703.1 hypothetical protein [Paeniclostridium ghonii]